MEETVLPAHPTSHTPLPKPADNLHKDYFLKFQSPEELSDSF